MKITITSKSLADAISWATRAFDNKDTAAHVDLVANSDGTVFLSHSNMTSFMRSPVEATNVDIEGRDTATLALSGQNIIRLGSVLDGKGEVVFSKKLDSKTDSLEVRGPAGKFTIPVVGTTVAKTPSFVSLGEADEGEYFDLLKRLSQLADPESGRSIPALGTVDIKMDYENKSLVVMATDRYVLGEISIDFTPNDENLDVLKGSNQVLLPHESAVKVTSGTSGSVFEFIRETSSTKGAERFGYSFSDGRIALFSLSEAKPVNYAGMKKTSMENLTSNVILSASALKKTIGMISTLAWEETTVKFVINNEKFVVTDEYRNNVLEIPAEEYNVSEELLEDNEEFEVVFSRVVINKIFNAILTNKMRLNWSTSEKPFVIESVMDNDEIVKTAFALAVPSIQK